eukprot:Colp12_sorted_trinity150504_noHs@26198
MARIVPISYAVTSQPIVPLENIERIEGAVHSFSFEDERALEKIAVDLDGCNISRRASILRAFKLVLEGTLLQIVVSGVICGLYMAMYGISLRYEFNSQGPLKWNDLTNDQQWRYNGLRCVTGYFIHMCTYFLPKFVFPNAPKYFLFMALVLSMSGFLSRIFMQLTLEDVFVHLVLVRIIFVVQGVIMILAFAPYAVKSSGHVLNIRNFVEALLVFGWPCASALISIYAFTLWIYPTFSKAGDLVRTLLTTVAIPAISSVFVGTTRFCADRSRKFSHHENGWVLCVPVEVVVGICSRMLITSLNTVLSVLITSVGLGALDILMRVNFPRLDQLVRGPKALQERTAANYREAHFYRLHIAMLFATMSVEKLCIFIGFALPLFIKSFYFGESAPQSTMYITSFLLQLAVNMLSNGIACYFEMAKLDLPLSTIWNRQKRMITIVSSFTAAGVVFYSVSFITELLISLLRGEG